MGEVVSSVPQTGQSVGETHCVVEFTMWFEHLCKQERVSCSVHSALNWVHVVLVCVCGESLCVCAVCTTTQVLVIACRHNQKCVIGMS